jgi:hypothetical protein
MSLKWLHSNTGCEQRVSPVQYPISRGPDCLPIRVAEAIPAAVYAAGALLLSLIAGGNCARLRQRGELGSGPQPP